MLVQVNLQQPSFSVAYRQRWRKVVAQILWPVPEAAVTVLCSPDYGCDAHPKHVESDFAVNKYLHTVASCWILLILSYDAWNHEYKIHCLSSWGLFRTTKMYISLNENRAQATVNKLY